MNYLGESVMKLRKSQKIMLGIMGVFLAIGVISVSLYAGINDPNQENSLNPCPGPGTGNCVYENCPEAGETREESDICSGCDTGTPLEVTSGVNGQIAVWLGDAPQYSIDVSDIDRVLDGYKMRTGTVNIQCKVDWGPWSACDGTWINLPGDYEVNKWSPLANTSNDQVAWVDDVPGTVTSMTTACIGSVEVKAHVVDTGSGCYVDYPDDATPLTVNIASVDVEAVSGNNQYGNEDKPDCGDELPNPHEKNPGIIIPLDREDDDNDGVIDAPGDPNPTTYYSQVKLRGSGIPDGVVRIAGAKVDFWNDWEATAESPCAWSPAELPVNVYFRGTERSATVSDGQAVVTGGGSATDMVKITVVDIDLKMQGMPETGDDNEITTGGIVGLNNDDDNDNDTKDSEDPYNASDNDFVPMTLSFFPQDLTKGVITFTITSGAEHVRVFRKQGDAWILIDGSYEFVLSNEHPPFEFMVDGKSLSDARGVSFEAEYYAQDGQVRTTDVVKCTVMTPDIIVNNVEEEHEVDVGAYIMVNDADVNNKKVYDEDAPGTATQDIRPMVLKFPELDTGTMTLSGGAGNVKIWEDESKSTEVTLPKTWDLSASTEREYTYYIEGRSASGAVRDVSFDLQYVGEKITLEDKAFLTVVQVDLHGTLHYPVAGGEPVIELKEEEDAGQLPDESYVGMYIQCSDAGDDAHNSRIYIDVKPANLDHGTLTLTGGNRLQFPGLQQTQWQLPNKPTSDFIGVKGAAASASVKDTTIALTYNYAPQEAGYGDAISRTDEINATVVRVDVEMQGRTEADEETKGALVPQRWLILEPTGTKPAVAATLRVLPADLPAANAVIDFNSNLGMATDVDDQNPVANGTQWNLNQLPQTVYARGNSADQAVRGSHVKLTGHFTPPDGPQIELFDEVKVTVFNLDLVAANLSEAQEINPGAIIRLNNDNDNNNTVADRDEHPVQGENDLVELRLNITPATLDLGKVVVSGSGDTLTRLWNDQIKTTQLTLDQPPKPEWEPTNAAPASLWLEGYDLSTYDRTAQPPEQPDVQRKLTLEYEPGKKAVDQINATVGVIDLHFGGHAPFDADPEELTEEQSPGLVVDLNDADRDYDGAPDNQNDILERDIIDINHPLILDGVAVGHLHLSKLVSLPVGQVAIRKVAAESTGKIRIFRIYDTDSSEAGRDIQAQQILGPDDATTQNLYSVLLRSGDPNMYEQIEDGMHIAIEGVLPGVVVLEATYEEPSTGQKMTDKLRVTVNPVDLDIDSDNNNEWYDPQRTPDEDKIEDHSGDGDHPGKIIIVNDNDDDGDGIPDFADGFNKFGGTSNQTANEHFIPMVLEIKAPLDLSVAKLKITYSASDPAQIQRSGNGTAESPYVYTPAQGHLRIWTKKGDVAARNMDSVAAGIPGDYVPPGEYTLSKVGLLAIGEVRRKTFYVEAIARSDSIAADQIKVELDPDGDGPLDYTAGGDAVRATLAILAIGMDGNRDKQIQLGNPADQKCLFWVNDDHDLMHYQDWGEEEWQFSQWQWEEEDTDGDADCNDNQIGHTTSSEHPCLRDLEDFTVLYLLADDSLTKTTGLTYKLQFKNVTDGTPKVNLFQSVKDQFENANDFDYLTNRDFAVAQMNKTKWADVTQEPQSFPNDSFKSSNEPSRFLLESAMVGKGNLTLMVYKGANLIGERSMMLELQPITYFYEKYVVTADENGNVSATDGGDANHSQGQPQYTPEKPDRYFLFIHGWNMPELTKDRWAETVFKRLWWQGYKGHVGCFQWPTFIGSYNHSERRAWNSAGALLQRLTALNTRCPGKVSVLAHSMGNVVTGEALRQSSSQLVNTYIAAQAAISAHCYDNTVPNYWSGYSHPNIQGYYPISGETPSVEYLAANNTKAGKLITYYNIEDYALGWWETNNKWKPSGYLYLEDDFYFYDEGDGNVDTYLPTRNGDIYRDMFYQDLESNGGTNRDLSLPADQYEIFSRILQSRSTALGRVDPNISSIRQFRENRNLQTWGYDRYHYSHSREFLANIIDEKSFWDAIVEDAALNQ